MLIGVDYYPEHWDRADWEPHAKLMVEGGFKVVRLAEFAWHKMEPREGRYDFQWLDDAIAVLRRHDIKVILGTPTASPPPWLVTKHPDTLAVNQDGVRTEAGGRRHYCYSSPVYREASRKIVASMAAHFAEHPSVIGWQTDNEIGGPRCWCDPCAKAFRAWLKTRYGTVDALNAAHGSVFWGQTYNDWDEIPIPREKHASHSVSLRLDHLRFHSDNVLSYHDAQVAQLRHICPKHFITHNCMGFYDEVDYFALAKGLDHVSLDYYPGNLWGQGKFDSAKHDYTRSLKHKPWWVMEQRSGLTGWLDMFNSGDQPGQLRLWTWQTVAHGADAVVFFRWRTARFGIEQYWHGILDHHGQPGRRFRELSRVAKEFGVLNNRTVGASVAAPAGILIDPESRWALDIQKGSPHFSFLEHANGYHRAFHEHHVGVEYYQPSDDFSGAKVLVAPSLFLCDATLAAKLTAFVEAGGTLITTLRTGVKDAANVVTADRLPGVLKTLTGCIVEEYDAYVNREEYAVESVAPLPKKPGSAKIWADQLRLTGAKPLARYAAGPFKGSPAASIHKVGQGTVIYVGFVGDAGFNRNLVKWVLAQHHLLPPFPPSDDIEITERVKGKDRFLFVLNHSGSAQKMPLKGKTQYRDLLTGKKTGRMISLAPYDVKVLSAITVG